MDIQRSPLGIFARPQPRGLWMVLRLVAGLLRAIRSWIARSIRRSKAREGRIERQVIGDGLPPYCLRGLRDEDWVIDGRFVDTRAFMPNVKTAASRSDGGAEV